MFYIELKIFMTKSKIFVRKLKIFRTFGDTKGPWHTGHFVLELVKAPPPRGDEERPEIAKCI